LVEARKEISPFLISLTTRPSTRNKNKKQAQQVERNPQGQEGLHCRGGPEGIQAVPLLRC
jgi:hypothetical protein